MPDALPPETREWLKTQRHCDKCFPLEDAVKLYSEVKSYPRGESDYAVRTELDYPSTPEQLAIRLPIAQNPEAKPKRQPKPAVAPGVEVPLESVLKYTKTGLINTQSTIGKVADLALSAGCEVKAGRSEAITWSQGAHHGLRFSFAGTSVIMNGRVVPKEELLIRLEEIA
jgi:hypothetical protein